MTATWSGALIGLCIAVGFLVVIARLRATAPLTLRERITPFVPDLRRQEREHEPSTWHTLQALVRTPRLSSSHDGHSVRTGSLERLIAVSAGVGAGAALGFVIALRGSSGVVVVLIAGIGGVSAELARSTFESRTRRQARRRISAELPDLAELLAFAVAAGESPPAALTRISGMASGELGILMRRVTAEMRLGTGFDEAMRDLVLASGCADVERFVDGLLLAMERGTPLAELLRAQAADARAAQSRRLLESAGRKDVAMLIPIVFLILPTVVLIALFPGFRSLHLFIN